MITMWMLLRWYKKRVSIFRVPNFSSQERITKHEREHYFSSDKNKNNYNNTLTCLPDKSGHNPNGRQLLLGFSYSVG